MALSFKKKDIMTRKFLWKKVQMSEILFKISKLKIWNILREKSSPNCPNEKNAKYVQPTNVHHFIQSFITHAECCAVRSTWTFFITPVIDSWLPFNFFEACFPTKLSTLSIMSCKEGPSYNRSTNGAFLLIPDQTLTMATLKGSPVQISM